MKKVHFTDPYILNPQHEITIALIGVGGTGSQLLTSLGRMDTTLKALGHPGLFVTVYDPDVVTPANCGRQLFTVQDMGLHKASCLVTRINRYFGTDWNSIHEKYNGYPANIVITCTDNIASRLDVHKVFMIEQKKYINPYERFIYWIDCGNTRSTGQVVLGSTNIKQPKSRKFETVARLPTVTELFDYSNLNEKDSGPSCSLAAALQKQDLFINSTLSQFCCGLLWKLFRECMIEYQGVFLNLDTLKSNPIKIKQPA